MKWSNPSFTFLLSLTLILVSLVEWSEGGRIVRAWRRKGRGEGKPYSPWSLFRRRNRLVMRGSRPMMVYYPHEEEAAGTGRSDGEASLLSPVPSESTSIAFLSPIGRRPTFDYVPPAVDQVLFRSEALDPGEQAAQRRNGRQRRPRPPFRRRRLPQIPPRDGLPQWNRRKTQYSRPTPLIWKLLNRQRWRRPGPGRRPLPAHQNYNYIGSSSEEAEVIPYIPNIVFFQASDVIGVNPIKSNATMLSPITSTSNPDTSNSSSSSTSSPPLLRPGKVTSVPLYPIQFSPLSEFKPMTPTAETPNKEYVFRVVELQQLKRPTPAPYYKSVPPPSQSSSTTSTTTESMLPIEFVDPPKPIKSFQINIDALAEGSEKFLQVVPDETTTSSTSTIPTTTTTTISTSASTSSTTTTMSTTTTTTTTTLKPIFALREEPAIVEEITVIPEKDTKKPPFQFLLPTYQSKNRLAASPPKPLSKPISTSKEEIGSSIMITGIRSKVKEYKPQIIANFTQLLAFDKVVEPEKSTTFVKATISEENGSLASRTSRESFTSTPISSSPSTIDALSEEDESSSTTSPLQGFDPLKLIHSWFMKT